METYIDVDCDDYGKEFNTPRFHFVSKNYESVYDYCHYAGKYRAAAHSICNLRDKTSKEILVVFHNVLHYDYHFIVRQWVEEFERQFECTGENTEKCITFVELNQKQKKENHKIHRQCKIHCQLSINSFMTEAVII